MVIGFDASRAFTKSRTGTENYSYLLLQNLIKIDRDNRYILYYRPGSVVPDVKLPDNFELKLIDLPFLWTQVGLSFELFKNTPDVLLVSAHTLPIIRPARLKTVMTVHDLGSEYLPSLHQIKQQLYLKFITHFQMRTASRLIAVSEATKKDLTVKIGIPGSHTEVIYEGTRFEGVKRPEKRQLEHCLDKYSLDAKKFFLFVGTVQPRKNLRRVIEAFALYLQLFPHASGFKLIIAGSPGWDNDQIYELPGKLGIEKFVKFLGRTSDQDLICLYSSASALIFPSLFEGFGLPILEAFHFGCPVITSNISSMPEIAGKAAVLVDPTDVKQIMDAMADIIQNDVLRDRLVVDGYSREKVFSFQETAKQTLGLLQKLVEGDSK